MKTSVPTFAALKTTASIAFGNRTQPCDTLRPIDDASSVP
jgi:hypothetical protein